MTLLDLVRPSVGPPVVLQVTGDLDLGTQTSFESEAFHHLDRGSLVVDLSRLGFLGISALRSLLLTDRYATSRGRVLVFCGPSRSAQHLLALTRLDTVLTLRRSTTAACVELRSASGTVRTAYWRGECQPEAESGSTPRKGDGSAPEATF